MFKKYLEFLGRDPEYVEQLKATLEMTGGKEAFLNWIHTEEVFSKHHSYAEEPQGEIITILEGWYQDAFYQKD